MPLLVESTIGPHDKTIKTITLSSDSSPNQSFVDVRTDLALSSDTSQSQSSVDLNDDLALSSDTSSNPSSVRAEPALSSDSSHSSVSSSPRAVNTPENSFTDDLPIAESTPKTPQTPNSDSDEDTICNEAADGKQEESLTIEANFISETSRLITDGALILANSEVENSSNSSGSTTDKNASGSNNTSTAEVLRLKERDTVKDSASRSLLPVEASLESQSPNKNPADMKNKTVYRFRRDSGSSTEGSPRKRERKNLNIKP